jgi:hypothetical protein
VLPQTSGNIERQQKISFERTGLIPALSKSSRKQGLARTFLRQNGVMSAGAWEALSASRSHVDHISQKTSVVSQKMDNNPVSQTSFARGGVALF